MKQLMVSRTGADRVIVLFAGWSMDSRPFENLVRPGYDILVVWDYRSMDIDWSTLQAYKEICIVAWSLGVYAASVTTHTIEPRVTAKIAVNGTLYPVDNRLGIPEAVYTGTERALDARNLRKFHRRMCGSAEAFARFSATAPERTDIQELRDELNAIYPAPIIGNPRSMRWDRAIISRGDAIFPPENQWRAWQGVVTDMVDGAHYLPMQTILDRYIIDKQHAGACFDSHRSTYDTQALIQKKVIAGLLEAMSRYGVTELLANPAKMCLEIGSGTGLLTRGLLSYCEPRRMHLWDIGPDATGCKGHIFNCCDAEVELCRTLPQRYDVIASASTVQWFNSPARFITECARVLRPGGYLALTSFISGNMEEIRTITGVGLPLLTLRQWLSLLPDSLELIVARDYTASLHFESPADVFRHLRLTGVNGLGRGASARISMRNALERYPRMLDGMCHLTYRPFILIARKKS